MAIETGYAPGWPGIPARWMSSAKSGVGTSLSNASSVWFTISHGILNEVYYPRVDQACTRDMGLIVTDGVDFFSEEKRHTTTEVAYLASGVPAYRLINTCTLGRYRIEKEILTDPRRSVLLQKTHFVRLKNADALRLYVLLAPHLGNRGAGNTGWVGDYKGIPMLFAQRDGVALALACSSKWRGCSAGFAGFSDGWQDLSAHKLMQWQYERAENGNIALTGEIDFPEQAETEFTLALGFGQNAAEAGHRARAALDEGFESAKKLYVAEWQSWQKQCVQKEPAQKSSNSLFAISTAVLRTHEAKRFPGGMIASLSIPWGFAKGDDDLGGYHLVWPRDLVETAGGLLAAGAKEDAHRILHYLNVTQEADGHWPQNMWLDGTPYWNGVQMDETAFPILLVDLAKRANALESDDLQRLYPMVRKAAQYLVGNGPVTQQDRWEEDPGYSPFTLAVEVSALVIAAELAELNHETQVATYLRETADVWNDSIERWTYVTGTDLAEEFSVDGYYVRIAAVETTSEASPISGYVPIKNRPPGESLAEAAHIISPDALALVRFGLRSPDDPKILNTTKIIDALLKVETPVGPAWHRYNEDGYGEHEDGSPFDGTGIGRVWPLLTGERAHYELAAGHLKEAQKLFHAFQAFANEGGMLPEQVWDAPDLPEHELFFGRPAGSAMPLVWAHAEYLKLLRSLQENRVFDLPRHVHQRYVVNKTTSKYAIWRFNQKCRVIPQGKLLRIEVKAPAVVHWSADQWATSHDQETNDSGLGIHFADLPRESFKKGQKIVFTFYWPEDNRWENQDFEVIVQ